MRVGFDGGAPLYARRMIVRIRSPYRLEIGWHRDLLIAPGKFFARVFLFLVHKSSDTALKHRLGRIAVDNYGFTDLACFALSRTISATKNPCLKGAMGGQS